jgi:hypothetical protein
MTPLKQLDLENSYSVANMWVTKSKPNPFYQASQGEIGHMAVKIIEIPRITAEELIELIERARLYKVETVIGLPHTVSFKIVRPERPAN